MTTMERQQEIGKQKFAIANDCQRGTWMNDLEEAISRFEQHAHNFDSRDIQAFRFIAYEARQMQQVRLRGWPIRPKADRTRPNSWWQAQTFKSANGAEIAGMAYG